MVTEVGTGRKPAQMVWASVWLDERGQPRNKIALHCTKVSLYTVYVHLFQ
jgi:hypothetical protein